MAERSRPPNGSSKLCGDHPAKLGTEEAEMQIIGVDLHTRQQTVAMLNVETGEVIEKTLRHEGDSVREFYSTLPRPTQVGIEATGSMQWFLELMEELGIDCEVGHPAKIRAAEPRKQKHDRRDAALVLQLLVENRFPSIWMPSREQRDVRSLILYRHQWVRIRTRVQNALQAIALSHGFAARLVAVEQGRPARDRLVVTHSLYSRTADRTAIAVSAPGSTDRRLKSKGRRVGLATTSGTAADDSSRSGTDYSSGDGNLFG